MRKRLRIDIKHRQSFFRSEFKNIVLKYASIFCGYSSNNRQLTDSAYFLTQNILKNQEEDQDFMSTLKNKSFKLRHSKTRINSKIRNYCIVSGRARGLSKNYFSLSRNSFKHLQSIGLLPGTFKSN